MAHLLNISDSLYQRLEAAARKRGLNNIEQLLEEWPFEDDDLDQRREAVRRIDTVRERLFATYGEMPDSVALVQEDRARLKN
jgi:hypothetical protein